jgi:arginine decarboxylase
MTNAETILTGNRIPTHYFLTTGTGESDLDIHTGSFHLALYNAGIHSYNVMYYSSILPLSAREVELPKDYVHGSVLEAIAAQADVRKGERATAGLIVSQFYFPDGKKFGGAVCEYNGNASKEEAKQILLDRMNELHQESYGHLILNREEDRILVTSIVPTKQFGTALALLGFVSYEIPIIRNTFKEK